ncbi:MAG: HEPN domain-containing protein [Deltaproteobacteria bacterium]|nr:HEPN domain-containing protein [Deltaproteobacteria bacterium]
MKNMATNEMIAYWVTSSDRDYQVMIDLFQKGHYTWSLFIGHLVIEKLLKAVCSQKRMKNPPLIHDLLRLAEKGDLDLDEEQKDILDTVTTFNIQARYDDYKSDFHNKCTKDFTQKWVRSIKEFRIWLKQNHLKQF